MLSVSLPSLRSFLPFPKEKKVINLPPVKTHDIEAPEKPARALKYLLKLNHANYAILYNHRKFHNHAPHLLGGAFLQGADADDLSRIYESESKLLEAWQDSPAEVTDEDWRSHLGRREYEKAFVDYYEDELVRLNYDWKEVVEEYLFSGDEPIFSSILADLGHPLIHLAYAYETNSREVAIEALGLASVCYNSTHKYLDEPIYSQTSPSYQTTSLFEILDKVRSDTRFDDLPSTPDHHNLLNTHEAAVLEHWNAWKIEDPLAQFRESQELAAALFSATHGAQQKYDFFLVHVLTTSHAVRVLLPLIPARLQIPLLRQWWLMALTTFIGQHRLEIRMERVENYELEGRGWEWVAGKAVKGEYSVDVHYVKAVRALEQMAGTWEDGEDFYLKAAVQFADEFGGWGF
ncbi:hypothetical protein N7466_006124, partial [Penicillium verhagenii]|uniref:uncharacterized protein n=1 Tax=Penicillium verhagenii TaxID=1562060 RepID=UPI00254534A2